MGSEPTHRAVNERIEERTELARNPFTGEWYPVKVPFRVWDLEPVDPDAPPSNTVSWTQTFTLT